MTACPPDEHLVAYVGGVLEAAAHAVIAEHLDVCDGCREVVVLATRANPRSLSIVETVVVRPDTAPLDEEAYCPTCNASFEPDRDTCPTDGSRLIHISIPKDNIVGRTLDGRYEVESVLGEGGMGTVYRGRQLSMDREVAIKVIHPRLVADRVAVKRFLREARLSSRLGHPAIVSVYDFGQTERVLYLVMELLRGHTLAHELERGALPTERVIRIGTQICDALDAAHALGIVHRDLKPSNVVILDGDAIKVLDFGLAKSLVHDTAEVTHSDAIVGTPLYMSPEQIAGDGSDSRSDLYALGCLLYEMVSGAPPFRGTSGNALALKHTSEPAPALPASVPSRLRALIERLLAKSPAARPQTAREVRIALEHVQDAEPPRRRRWWIAAAMIAIAGAVGIAAAQLVRTPAPPASAPVVSAPIDAAEKIIEIDAAAQTAVVIKPVDPPPPPPSKPVRTRVKPPPPPPPQPPPQPAGSGSSVKKRCADCPF